MTLLKGYTVVYGGSFDPPHSAHQMACLYLCEGLGAEEVWVVPSYHHPFAKAMVAFEHRFAMCEAMAAPLGERVKVLDVEQRLGGLGRTYDTLVALKAQHPNRRWALAVGADIMPTTSRWYRWDAIEGMAKVVVLGRAGYSHPRVQGVDLPEISSTDIRAKLAKGEEVQGLVPVGVLEYIRAHHTQLHGQYEAGMQNNGQ